MFKYIIIMYNYYDIEEVILYNKCIGIQQKKKKFLINVTQNPLKL